jgi:hypothetical protein
LVRILLFIVMITKNPAGADLYDDAMLTSGGAGFGNIR